MKPRREQTAKAFGIQEYYSDAAEMIREQRPDVLDVITSPATHRQDGRVGSIDQDPGHLSKADGQ